MLQKILVYRGTSTVPDTSKQGSAFPPNFIHSLDSTHMMMTALACKDTGETPLMFSPQITIRSLGTTQALEAFPASATFQDDAILCRGGDHVCFTWPECVV